MRPFFSLIIPCINSEPERIRKLFDSLTRQRIGKNELEIIVVDDASDDKNYQMIIKDYEKQGFNVIWTETNTDFHCPGNTRRKGMEYVSGEWLCFCDHDDYFEDGVLKQIQDYIKVSQNPIYCITTTINEYDDENQQYLRELAHKTVWLHGKFYSMDNLIKPYNINFKENLTTNEDAYFNCCCIDAMLVLKVDYDYLDLNTYRWIKNIDSLSHTQTGRGYLFDRFDEYIIATTEPYWEDAIRTKDVNIINQIMMAFLHCYFYYEYVSFAFGSLNYRDVLVYITDLCFQIMERLECGALDIIDFIYADAERYHNVLEDCEIATGHFIPNTSFRDFVLKLILDL